MEPCASCGAALSADVEWCGQCYAVRPRAAAVVGGISAFGAISGVGSAPAAPVTPAGLKPTTLAPSVMSAERGTASRALLPIVVKSRWRKTHTTFGPVGRILATVALVLPFIVFVVIGFLTGGLTIVGAVIWGSVIMPWGLRDTWRAGHVPSP